MCASKQMIVVNNTKKRKLQYISLAYSDKLTPQIGAIPFCRLGQQLESLAGQYRLRIGVPDAAAALGWWMRVGELVARGVN
jgi:hypothetical protein